MPPETAPSPVITPPPQTVNFVCEADVRAAISEGRKIFIHSKSIVTPSARDAAAPGDILVLA
ncbi:MAG: hypothetical protein WBY44_18950 [Bryobacteraceae bacterium]